MDFSLTEEQQQLRRSVREFAEGEIAPHVMEWDEASHFPMEIMPKLAEMGLLGVIFPEEVWRRGAGIHRYAIAIEELSRVDGRGHYCRGAQFAVQQSHFQVRERGSRRKSIWCRWRRVRRWRMVADRAGSRFRRGGTKTTAARDGNHWVLNGAKTFTTNGHYADVCVAMAVTDKSEEFARDQRIHPGERNAGISSPGKKKTSWGCAPATPRR